MFRIVSNYIRKIADARFAMLINDGWFDNAIDSYMIKKVNLLSDDRVKHLIEEVLKQQTLEYVIRKEHDYFAATMINILKTKGIDK